MVTDTDGFGIQWINSLGERPPHMCHCIGPQPGETECPCALSFRSRSQLELKRLREENARLHAEKQARRAPTKEPNTQGSQGHNPTQAEAPTKDYRGLL